MDDLQKIAVLVDADNTQLSKLGAVIREISTHGRIVVKRAYGNWKKDALKNWEDELKRLAIKAEQQFDYVPGKNATDMAMVIDTLELLHKEIYDAFVIVASDSDYTPLTIKLHESGVYVIGVGEKKTPESFRNSCDEFIFLENLTARVDGKNTKSRVTSVESNNKIPAESINEIHDLLKIASDNYQDADGYVNVGAAGSYVKRTKPDFDSRTYNYSSLTLLLEAFPKKYEVKKRPGKGNAKIVVYKCL